MTTTFSDSALAPESGLSVLKAIVIEPVLIVGAAFFWLVALPFVAISLMAVKIWDTVVGLVSGSADRFSPLILRRGLVKGSLAGRSSVQVRA